MRELADGLWMLKGWPRNAINVYVAGEVLIDAATRQGERRIMRQIAGRSVSVHALTHAHPDHQGSSHAICERLGIPLWCGRGDVRAMETPGGISNLQAPGWLNALQQRFWTGPPHPVARALSEGDEVAGFTVLESPGHSPGQVAYWRESDRVLILGDVLNNMNVRTGVPGLHEPPGVFTPDPPRNRVSARRLAELRPRLTCFGHGAPLRDPGRLSEFVAGMPRDDEQPAS
jgi:glyoxylase-like metal-dependent hydrolase (beta-lactamase superfamily II)